MKKCMNCGQVYEDKFGFCQKCGSKLEQIEENKTTDDAVESVKEKKAEKTKDVVLPKIPVVEVKQNNSKKVNDFVQKVSSSANGFDLKRLYLLIASIVGGAIVLLICVNLFIKYKSLTGSSDLTDVYGAINNAVGTVKSSVTFFYLVLILNLAVIGGYIYRLVQMNDKRKSSLLALGTVGVSEVVALILLPTVMTVGKVIKAANQIMSGSYEALASMGNSISSLSNNLTSIKVSIILFLIAEIATIVVAGYLIYLEKTGKELSVDDLQKSGAEAIGALKEYVKTEKGRKNAIIIAGICGALVICLLGTGIYNVVKKTPLNLMTACEVRFSGHDGAGYVNGDYNYGCNPDYDQTNSNISTFMNTVSYSIDKSEDLSNGDTVTITANYSEETAKSLKLKITESTKTFKVKGLTKVYKTWADIPKKTREKIVEKAQNKVEKKAKNYSRYFGDETVTVDSVEHLATYYSYDKDYGQGKVIPVYKVSITDQHGDKTDNFTLYYYTTVNVDGSFKASDSSAFSGYMDYFNKEEDETETDALDYIMRNSNVDEDNLVYYASK